MAHTSKTSLLHKTILALSVSMFAVAAVPMAASAFADKDTKENAKEVKKQRVIKVLKPGKTLSEEKRIFVVKGVDKDSKGRIIVSNSHIPAQMDKHRLEQIEKAKHSIEKSKMKIEKKLSQADSEEERYALEIALESLESARASLDEQSHFIVKFNGETDALGHHHMVELTEALKGVEINQLELEDVRIELIEELSEAKDELREALDDIELEINIDEHGEVHELRIKALKEAKKNLEGMEERHLEAIKQAEESLKRTRAELERKLAEKKARADKKKKDK